MTLRALMDNVIIKQYKSASQTASGIKLPEHDIHQGQVISVGPDCPTGQLKINSSVAFTAYSGTTVTLDGEDFLILKFDDIAGTIHEVAQPPKFYHKIEPVLCRSRSIPDYPIGPAD